MTAVRSGYHTIALEVSAPAPCVVTPFIMPENKSSGRISVEAKVTANQGII